MAQQINKIGNKEIRNDYSFISKGAKLTQDLSDFLKGTEIRVDTISNIASYYFVKAEKLQRLYKKYSSGFNE